MYLLYRPNTGLQIKQEPYADLKKKYKKVTNDLKSLVHVSALIMLSHSNLSESGNKRCTLFMAEWLSISPQSLVRYAIN